MRGQKAHIWEGALSVVEILVTLYYQVMKNNPKNRGSKRDRLILSKAHDAKALFAVLAERGYFDKKFLRVRDG